MRYPGRRRARQHSKVCLLSRRVGDAKTKNHHYRDRPSMQHLTAPFRKTKLVRATRFEHPPPESVEPAGRLPMVPALRAAESY